MTSAIRPDAGACTRRVSAATRPFAQRRGRHRRQRAAPQFRPLAHRTELGQCRLQANHLGLRRPIVGAQLINALLRRIALRKQRLPRLRSAAMRTRLAFASARLASACSISVGLAPCRRLASCLSACARCCAAWSRAARSSVSSWVNSNAPVETASPRLTATEVSSPGCVVRFSRNPLQHNPATGRPLRNARTTTKIRRRRRPRSAAGAPAKLSGTRR